MPRIARIAGPALLLFVAFVALFASLAYGGGAQAPLAADPGPVVLYGLPIAKMLVNLGAAGTIGALTLACFAFASKKPEFGRALDVAAGSAAVWAVASAATGFFTFQSVYGVPITLDNRFGDLLSAFMSTTELGQAWLGTTLIAAALTVLCFAVRNQTAVAFIAVGAIIGLVPMSLQGHAGGTADHDAATTSIWLHVLFAAIWLGGLLTIVLARSTIEKNRLVPVMERYSTFALIAFIVVAASGYVNAQIRVETLANLLTPYGILVLVKTFTLCALGIFGVVQRRFLIARMQAKPKHTPRYFWALVAAELAFMGIASGVAAALARTADPKLDVPASQLTDPTPAEFLTGAALPPPPSFANYVLLWNFDLLWILVCAFGIFFYIAGVVRLHRRGDKWPVYRTVLWVAGMLLLFWITNGGINAYEKYLFSAHMLGHMILGMAVPVLLVPGAPITLALRAIRKRSDASRGPREWILLLVHSRYFRLLANPIVAAGLFAGSLLVFYYTPLLSWATTDHIGHEWMIIHFVAVGYLFVQSLIGIDPVPYRPPYPLRLLILLGTMAFHAFFGLSLLTGTGLLLSNWYGAMGWHYGVSAIADQQIGGGIAWSVGELPTITLAIVVALMWARSDKREATRYDRRADRDGDAELAEYNAMLARRGAAK
ncbi:MAG: copper transporter [Glaciihabitans sp.]|nr:copper transporter [Glaciihabitans sp.]